MKSPYTFWIISGLTIVLPTLVVADVVPFSLRFYILVAMALLVLVASRVEQLTSFELGLTKTNLKPAFLIHAPLIVLLLLVLLFAPALGLAGRKPVPESPLFYVFYVLISSPAQELIYRSYFYAEVKRRKWSSVSTFLVLLLPYVYLHIIYKDILTLAFVSIIGVLWSLLYMQRPNLIAIAISHAILGAVTIMLGLI